MTLGGTVECMQRACPLTGPDLSCPPLKCSARGGIPAGGCLVVQLSRAKLSSQVDKVAVWTQPCLVADLHGPALSEPGLQFPAGQ